MAVLKFNTVKEIDAGKEIPGFKSYCKNRSDCLYKDKTRKYHGWTHLDNLKLKKPIQCGYHAGGCKTATVYGIGGYRNTCPIAGMNGDYPCPAKLQIKDFDFASHKITKKSTIKSITVSFKHRVNGVDTGSGKQYYGPYNSPNFGEKPVSVYFSNNSGVISKKIKGATPNNKEDKKYTSVTCKFTDVTAAEIFAGGFALNIEYTWNRNTNPGIVWIDDFSVSIDFKNPSEKATISSTNKVKSLYTSTVESCQTSLTYIITSKGNGAKISANSVPYGVNVTEVSNTKDKKTFRITDGSGIGGRKKIGFIAVGTKLKTSVSYDAIVRPLPTYEVVTEYKAGEDYDSSKTYIRFKNGCSPGGIIWMYIDSLSSNPIPLNVVNQNSSSNLIGSTSNEAFHFNVKHLSCGYHTLYFNRGGENFDAIKNNQVTVHISPMNFEFEITNTDPMNLQQNNCDLVGQDSLTFCQSKKSDTYQGSIQIKRIDNEPKELIEGIRVIDSTQPKKVTDFHNFTKGKTVTYNISKYYAGKYKLSLFDLSSNSCKKNRDGKISDHNIQILSSHKQNYDYLFTRGQDGTAFNFDYLVGWEGDHIKEPLNVNKIDLKHSFDSLHFCSEDSSAGLSQINTIELKIRNKTEDLLENINIELNVLKINENDVKEVTTEEWVSPNGIFNQFYDLFYEYNLGQEKNIEIKNLTPDNDLIDEENVYLRIKKIEAEDALSIFLPYRSASEKVVFLQYLLFEEPVQLSNFTECGNEIYGEDDPTEIQITVHDSMLTDLSIEGNTDLLSLDPSYPCPTECYTTVDIDEQGNRGGKYTGGVTYKITNIDTSDFLGLSRQTQIVNSPELIPYAYKVDGKIYNLLDENNNLINPPQEIDENGDPVQESSSDLGRLEYINDITIIDKPIKNANIKATVDFQKTIQDDSIEIPIVTYTIKTDKKGLAHFYIPISTSLNQSYSINQLLSSEVLSFEFLGNNEYNPSELNKNSLESNEVDLEEADLNEINYNSLKNDTELHYIDNYRKYKPGETADILIYLEGNNKIYQNYFNFYTLLEDNGHSDQVTILYKICNLKDNKGIFTTTFKTNDKDLIKNEVSKKIYAGVNTNINVKTNIEKKIVENHNINVIDISVENQEKENHDVIVKIDLGKHLYPNISYLGRYDFLDINIDGDYSITEENGNIFVSWLIGRMDSFETKKGVIMIKAKDVGLSEIDINCYDYLHPEGSEAIPVGESLCTKCEESTTKWTLKDSRWKEFDGQMYKLFDDGVYRRRVNNEWVDKKFTENDIVEIDPELINENNSEEE